MSPSRIATGILMTAALLLSACDREDRDPATQPVSETDAMTLRDGMDGMDGMGGMDGMDGQSYAMMARMAAHMQMMETVSGDSMQAMLAMHRQMMANMIAQMHREMRDMNMPADPAWNATVDSLRNDLVQMPQMNAGELQDLMTDHQRRARRLMEMHREMMEEMAM